jgi:hypothetical protein
MFFIQAGNDADVTDSLRADGRPGESVPRFAHAGYSFASQRRQKAHIQIVVQRRGIS